MKICSKFPDEAIRSTEYELVESALQQTNVMDSNWIGEMLKFGSWVTSTEVNFNEFELQIKPNAFQMDN